VIKGEITSQSLDDKVGETVVEIFKRFFESNDNVVIYVCDSSDDRHFARKRKFDWWFWKYNDGSIVKVDGVAVIANFEIYNSLLIHRENKLADKKINAFNTLNERADERADPK